MELKNLTTNPHSTVLFQSIYLIFIVASSTITVLKWSEFRIPKVELKPAPHLQPQPLVSVIELGTDLLFQNLNVLRLLVS